MKKRLQKKILKSLSNENNLLRNELKQMQGKDNISECINKKSGATARNDAPQPIS